MKNILIPVGVIALLALSYGFSSLDKKPAPAAAPVAAPAKSALIDADVF